MHLLIFRNWRSILFLWDCLVCACWWYLCLLSRERIDQIDGESWTVKHKELLVIDLSLLHFLNSRCFACAGVRVWRWDGWMEAYLPSIHTNDGLCTANGLEIVKAWIEIHLSEWTVAEDTARVGKIVRHVECQSRLWVKLCFQLWRWWGRRIHTTTSPISFCLQRLSKDLAWNNQSALWHLADTGCTFRFLMISLYASDCWML